MLFKLSTSQETDLLNQPETGMGYQVIEATKYGNYNKERFLVLNSEIVIEMNALAKANIRKVINEGIFTAKASASFIALNTITVFSEKQFRNIVSESINVTGLGAIDSKIEYADGVEVFVRLSAFEDDKRVDKENKCLRPGSFTTTFDDYINCKKSNANPIERYALPNDEVIKFVFHIQPKQIDTLQRGIVQPLVNLDVLSSLQLDTPTCRFKIGYYKCQVTNLAERLITFSA